MLRAWSIVTINNSISEDFPEKVAQLAGRADVGAQEIKENE